MRRIKNPFKRGTQLYRLLERLKQGEATNFELSDSTGLNIKSYRARISNLRDAGFNIVKINIRNTLWAYKLITN